MVFVGTTEIHDVGPAYEGHWEHCESRDSDYESRFIPGPKYRLGCVSRSYLLCSQVGLHQVHTAILSTWHLAPKSVSTPSLSLYLEVGITLTSEIFCSNSLSPPPGHTCKYYSKPAFSFHVASQIHH